ncbi:MAG TPA: dihydrofolate reductase family protein [Candidatus Saccharimonadales bacterium]|nr:dihydrofolate reductase family protein [Candidatus Saccharimonadales bacterium]
MRKIIVQEFITLDGVMQAPGGPEEDESGQFAYGGWTSPYFRETDDAAGEFMQEWMRSTDILLGRKTYDIFAAYWPEHTDMWPGINEVTKYVITNTLTENNTKWQNVVFLNSVDDLKKLKDSDGGDIKVHGSSKLAQTLFANNLVDELHLITFPLVLGKGKRLFDENSVPAAFTLIDSLVIPNGVIFASYKRGGEVKTGTVGE